jgi:DNA-binding LacI/PurR family transcriptional regulator
MSPPTMRDVARMTGVSQSTVSRVLSGAPTSVPIAPATRDRIMAAARQLGYRPNPLARGLRGARTMLLGVIVREITDPFFAVAVEAVSIEAGRLGYNVVLGHAHGRSDEALALWGILEARHCDAILLLGDQRDQPGLMSDLAGSRVPVVALWYGSRTIGIPTVNVDNRAGIEAVMDHLAGLGHRRIAFAGRRPFGDVRDREDAYVAALERLGEPVRSGYLQHVANDFKGGVDALERLVGLPEPPTAVVGATDVIAIGILHAAQRRGMRVPEDLSVTGFDDIPVAEVSVPALTTVRMPVREMVAAAVAMAIGADGVGSNGNGAVSDPTPEAGEGALAGDPLHPVLHPSLVVRSSTGPAPHRRQGGT